MKKLILIPIICAIVTTQLSFKENKKYKEKNNLSSYISRMEFSFLDQAQATA